MNTKQKTSLISVSGRLKSGKDTTGQIINILLNSPHLNNEGVMTFLRKGIISKDNWQIKKFADKLKDIVCLLLGCSREDLENQEFKETVLGEEWWSIKKWYPNDNPDKVFTLIPYEGFDERIFNGDDCMWEVIKMTPRLMLQLMGTECGRQLIHPQIWVNSLMSDYKPLVSVQPVLLDLGSSNAQLEKMEPPTPIEYPNWVITDCRFPNELEAVEKKRGVTIRVVRPWFYELLKDGRHEFSDKEDKTGHVYRISEIYNQEEAEVVYKEVHNEKLHPSETALDSSVFQYEIINDGTMEDLINKIRDILIKEGLL